MTYVSLLRGVNVGGNQMVAMAGLRALLGRLGFSDVKSLLQSGNLVFRAPSRSAARLESLLETEVEKRLGLKVDFHVRTVDEWNAVVDANPFRDQANRDPGRLLVTFFKEPLLKANVKALQGAITGPETLYADGRHLFMVFPDGSGNSKAARIIEKKLGARGTARNWNTVLKLAQLAALS